MSGPVESVVLKNHNDSWNSEHQKPLVKDRQHVVKQALNQGGF